MSKRIPLEGGNSGYITVPGQDDSRLRKQLFEWNYVPSDYHRAFGIPIAQGQPFDARDKDRAEVVGVAGDVKARGIREEA